MKDINRLVLSSVEMTFRPVPMAIKAPSMNPDHWLAFLVTGGDFVTLESFEADRVQFFMRREGTEAIEDIESKVTYTLAGNRLVQCDVNFEAKKEHA